MNHDVSFITSMVVLGYVVFQESYFLPRTICHKEDAGGGIMFLGMFSWTALGTLVAVEQTIKAQDYPNIIVGQMHSYMAFVFSTGIFL